MKEVDRMPGADSNIGLDVKLVRTPQELSEAKALMYEVARERNWPAEKVIEGNKDRSLIWIAYEKGTGNTVGAVKLVYGEPNSFPMKKVGAEGEDEAWPNLVITETSGSAEVAFAAIRKPYRGNKYALLALYSKMYWDIQSFDIRCIYAILDRIIHVLYRRMGLMFVELGPQEGGGRKIYWGEETYPARLDLSETVDKLMRGKPEIWDFVQSFHDVA